MRIRRLAIVFVTVVVAGAAGFWIGHTVTDDEAAPLVAIRWTEVDVGVAGENMRVYFSGRGLDCPEDSLDHITVDRGPDEIEVTVWWRQSIEAPATDLCPGGCPTAIYSYRIALPGSYSGQEFTQSPEARPACAEDGDVSEATEVAPPTVLAAVVEVVYL